MLLRYLMILASLRSYSSAYNLETRETFPVYLRNGGEMASKNSSQEPAYAGFSFDVTLKNSSAWIMVGQPRAGVVGQTESPGALYYCNITMEQTEAEGSAIFRSATTTASYEATTGSGFSSETTELVTTSAPGVSSAYLRPTCNSVQVFDPSSRQQRGTDHKTGADALGLSLAKIGDDDEYAVCTPLRQKVCPNRISYSPGACYYGNTHSTTWNFVNWNETECFKNIIEIIFVVDGSFSIGKNDFDLVKKWLINVIRALINTYGEAARSQILQFSNKDPLWKNVKIENSEVFVIPYTLNDVYSMQEMEAKIENMPYLNGKTYTYYALRRAMVEFRRSDYSDVSEKIVVVLTDGEADDAIFLKDWYDANSKAVKSFAVGVGSKVRQKSLRDIANGNENDDRVLRVDNFDSLDEIVSNLTSEIQFAVSPEGAVNSSANNPKNDVGSPRIGTSISSSKSGAVYVGATGMYLSSGSVTQFNRSSGSMADFPAFSEVEAALPNRTRDSYMGYAVVTGFFDGPESKEYVASGAPRYVLRGAVVVYDTMKGNSAFGNPVTILAPEREQQIASYFGGCLLSVDVSGDGKDDLLVAAPLFAGDNYDEGRVFVYISQDKNSTKTWENRLLYTPIQLSGDNSEGARFGTAMADAGDMNLDGYNDVAIGAPLADGGQGAVYIYLGKAGGITEKPSQKIQASKWAEPVLHYFGHSLQGKIDVDGNQYPDVFVGAPKSDALVILKSRPVVKIYPTIEYAVPKVNIYGCIGKNYENCTSITVCLSANGTSVEPTIRLHYTLTLDSNKTRDSERRLVFAKDSGTTMTITTDISTARQYCTTEVLNMKENIKFNTDVTAAIDFDLSPTHLDLPFSSVLDPSLAKRKTASMGWMTGCVEDPCKHDLSVTAQLTLPPSSRNLPEKFTRGEKVLLIKSDNEKLTVRVNLTNSGEYSLRTRLNVTYPSKVSLLPASKFETNIAATKCVEEEGLPIAQGDHNVQVFRYSSNEQIMEDNSWCVFEFEVTTSALGRRATLDAIIVNVAAYTSSEASFDSNTSNNGWNETVKIRYQSDLNLRQDKSDANFEFNYTTQAKNITSIEEIGDNTPNVEVDFRITTGKGYSNIPSTAITFTWPWLTQDGNPLLYLYKLECDAKKSTCTCDNSEVNPYNLTIEGGNSTGGDVTVTPATSTLNASELNCPDTSGGNHTCEAVQCVVNDLFDTGEVHFRAFFRAWTSSIRLEESIRNETKLGMRFMVSSANSTLVVDDKFGVIVKSESISTKLRKFTPDESRGEEALMWFWYIIAAGGAFLVLMIIVIVLWACGFFKRKTDDDIRKDAQDAVDGEVYFRPNEGYENIDQTSDSMSHDDDHQADGLNTENGEMKENQEQEFRSSIGTIEIDHPEEDPDYDLPPDSDQETASNRESLEVLPPPFL